MSTFEISLAFVIFFGLLFKRFDSFNVDTYFPIIFKSQIGNSYFGFSLAFYRYSENEDIVLVGAPKADEDNGKIFKCVPVTLNCVSISNDYDTNDKKMQWLGVSVSSQNYPGGYFLACSHRSHKLNSNRSHYNFKGMCHLMGNELGWDTPLEPCDTCDLCAKENYVDCQMGSSSDVDKEGNVLLGGPSYFDANGIVYRYHDETRLYSESILGSIGKYSYLGTAVRIGKLINKTVTYAASAPKLGIKGKVFLMHETPENQLKVDDKHILTGEKPFSGFGNDLAIGDFNNDGFEDLVVGAPYYLDTGRGGAIYVYYNGPDGITSATNPHKILSRTMKESECLKLKCHDARFGFSLASVGDLDQDGYPDLVVGAPFEGNGVVYIFSGSSTHLNPKPSQRITASDIPLKNGGNLGPSFGYSLSQGPYDPDKNLYPDVAIGSFMTDHVVILRSRPVVDISLKFESSPSSLHPKKPTCANGGRPNQNCFSLEVCFKFKVKNKVSSNQALDMAYDIKIHKAASVPDRASFTPSSAAPNTSDIIRMERPQSDKCKQHWIYILPGNRDWLNPIEVSLQYNLTNLAGPTKRSQHELSSFDDYPILHHSNFKTQQKINVDFVKDCGTDNICNCDLKLLYHVKLDKNKKGSYEMKASDMLKLDVMVSNSGEDAHQTMLYVQLPPNVVFVGTESLIDTQQVPCSPSESNILVCDIVNPLALNETVTFSIKLNPDKLETSQEFIEISLHVNSTSSEKTPADNSALLKLDVVIEGDLSVVSHSRPSSIFYSHQEEYELSEVPKKHEYIEEIGPEIEHIFEVKNLGKVNLPGPTVVIEWPNALTAGHPLFYIVSDPEVLGTDGACTIDESLINSHELETYAVQYANLIGRASMVKRSTEDTTGINLRCGDEVLKCKEIICTINALKPGESAVIKIYSRFWNSTFQKDFPNDVEAAVYVKGHLIVSPNVKQVNFDNDVHESQTRLLRDERKEVKAPTWIYVVAILAGLLLLVLFVLILWKLGFFKRKKYEDLQQYSVTVTKKEENEADKK